MVVNMNDLMIADPNGPMSLPAHLQGIDTGVNKALLAGMFTGGNRIGLKGSRFRLIVAGIEEGVIEDNYLDTIILDAAPAVSRVFYAGAYKQGENVAPTCYSADGIVPNDDVKQKQSDKCATCPQNVKGSKIVDGQKHKACAYFRRLVPMLAGDVIERRTYKLDVKAMGLFGEGTPTSKNLNDYIKSLETRGVDIGTVVTRITFDLNSSTPKLLFRAVRYVTPDELNAVKDLVGSDEVKRLAEVSMSTLDFSGEEPTGGDTPQEAAQEPVAQAATPAAQRPQTTAQRPATQQTAQRPAQTVQRPAPQVETVPQQAVQQTQQTVQRPAVQTQQTARPATQQVQRPAQTVAQPVQQQPAAQEVHSNDELENILEGLD
jgi:hypothetical protein